MGIEDLGGLSGFGGGADGMSGFSMEDLQKQMVDMCKGTLDDLRKGQQQQQSKLMERQQQILNKKNGTTQLTPDQAQKWKELELMILANPEFIEPIGLTLAGLLNSKRDTTRIIEEYPDLRFAMVDFLRQQEADKKAAAGARTSAAPAASQAPDVSQPPGDVQSQADKVTLS